MKISPIFPQFPIRRLEENQKKGFEQLESRQDSTQSVDYDLGLATHANLKSLHNLVPSGGDTCTGTYGRSCGGSCDNC